MRRVIISLLIILFPLIILAQSGSTFVFTLQSKSTGLRQPGKNVDLYQNGVKKYDLTEVAPGIYKGTNIQTGIYDIRVNGSQLSEYSGIFIGGQKLVTIDGQFTDDGKLKVSTAINNGAITYDKLSETVKAQLGGNHISRDAPDDSTIGLKINGSDTLIAIKPNYEHSLKQIPTVNSISELTQDSLSYHNVVFMKGLNSGSNLGAGYLVKVDSTYPEYADGGVAFGAPESGKQWVRQEYLESKIIYANWDGVNADSTNSISNLNSMLNNIPDKSTIFFPKGNYYFDDDRIIVNKQLTFKGENGTVFYSDSSEYLHNRWIDTHFIIKNNVEFNNIKFKYWSAPICLDDTSSNININKIIIKNCKFESCKYYTILLDDTNKTHKVKNITIENNIIKNSESGIYISAPYLENVHVVDNKIYKLKPKHNELYDVGIHVGNYMVWNVYPNKKIIVAGNIIDSLDATYYPYYAMGIIVEGYDISVHHNIVTNIYSSNNSVVTKGIYAKGYKGLIDNNILVDVASDSSGSYMIHVKVDTNAESGEVDVKNNLLIQQRYIPRLGAIQMLTGGEISNNRIYITAPLVRRYSTKYAINVGYDASNKENYIYDNIIRVSGDMGGIIYNSKTNGKVRINDNDIECKGNGIYILGDGTGKSIEIENNKIKTDSLSAILVSGNAITEDLLVKNNKIYADSVNTLTYISLNAGKKVKFIDNEISLSNKFVYPNEIAIQIDCDSLAVIKNNNITYSGDIDYLFKVYSNKQFDFIKNYIYSNGDQIDKIDYVLVAPDSVQIANIKNNEIYGNSDNKISVVFGYIHSNSLNLDHNTFSNITKCLLIPSGYKNNVVYFNNNKLINVDYGLISYGKINKLFVLDNKGEINSALAYIYNANISLFDFINNNLYGGSGSRGIILDGTGTSDLIEFKDNTFSESTYGLQNSSNYTITKLVGVNNNSKTVFISNSGTIIDCYLFRNYHSGTSTNFLLNSGTGSVTGIDSTAYNFGD